MQHCLQTSNVHKRLLQSKRTKFVIIFKKILKIIKCYDYFLQTSRRCLAKVIYQQAEDIHTRLVTQADDIHAGLFINKQTMFM